MHVHFLDYLPAEFRLTAAQIFADALRDKLAPILGTSTVAQQIVAQSLDPNHCLIALCNGKLVGVLGIQNAKGSFLNLPFKSLRDEYGPMNGLFRYIGLYLLHHDAEPDEWYIDGIAVADGMRGQGIGSALLDLLERKALEQGIKKLSLEVIESNRKAKQLYERLGFIEDRRSNLWPFNHLLGFPFQHATQMVKLITVTTSNTNHPEED